MIWALAILLISGLTLFALRPAKLVDLAAGQHLLRADFYSLWDQGSVVVLMRHVERCDRSTNPCLAQSDGITAKGMHVAVQSGAALAGLGLSQTDIYNSPLRRTEQTSAYAFNRATDGQDWLIHCRGSMVDNMQKHKVAHRNLVLVTHSECISDVEKSLKVASPVAMNYGASLIVSINPSDHTTKVLGYIDAQDWKTVLHKRP